MPSNLSPAAKTKVAAVVAVVMAGVTAYQTVTAGGHFTWFDVIPVLAAIFGVATTDHVDNTIGSPAAKAIVHGALSLLAAITAALAAVVGSEPQGVSLTKLAVVGLGTLAVWAYPEAAPAVKTIEGEVDKGAPLPEIAATVAEGVALVAGDVSPSMRPDLPTAPAPAVTARQVDAGLPNSAWSPKPVAAGSTSSPVPAPASTPTPIADAVSGPPTQPFPAIPAQTATPAAPAVAPVPTA